jgi:LuxR family maltose regulon positive regulatory protein
LDVADPSCAFSGALTPAVAAIPLLSSKLEVPAPPGEVLDRPRLLDVVKAGVLHPVTVMSAPAGYGKTTLLASWVRTREPSHPVAWLTLEPADDAVRFWSYLNAALRRPGVLEQDGDAALPVPAFRPGEGYFAQLAEAFARLTRPVVVVLDDFDNVHDIHVLDRLGFVMRHAGGQLRLVLSTRANPALPLHRWRLSGDLTELGSRQLAFTEAETAQLLARETPPLDARQVTALHRRTEGWPAGLRLAALSLRTCPDRRDCLDGLRGDRGIVASYLSDEVLPSLIPEVRHVLVRTSILESVCGPLIDALTGRTDGEVILAELERVNAFVVPLGGRPAWYRYHRLFGDLLFAELHRQAPQEIPELHRRAARWQAEQGRPLQSLRHALVAQDWPRVRTVFIEHWRELMQLGHAEALRTDVPPPPDNAVRTEPELALAYAASRLGVGDRRGANSCLRRAERYRHAFSGDRGQRFRLMMDAFRLVDAQLAGDVEDVRSLAPQVLARVDKVTIDEPHGEDGEGDQSHGEQCARAIALTALGTAQLAAGDVAAAEVAMTGGFAAAEEADLLSQRAVCGANLAMLWAVRGELQRAARAARAALAMPPGQDGCQHSPNRAAYLALAATCYQRNQLPDAERYLDLATHSSPMATEPFVVFGVTLLKTWLLQAQGDLVRAYQALIAGRRDLSTLASSHYMNEWLGATEADLRTLRGDTAGARNVIAPLVDGTSDVSAPLTLALARTHLRDGHAHAATAVLRRWSDDRTAEHILWLRLDGGLLDALAMDCLGQHGQAHRAVEAVLDLAEPEDCQRIFVQGGPPLRKMLLTHVDSGTAHWAMVTELIDASDDRRAPVSGEEPQTLLEPLSSREITVLRYLQSLLSNREIAGELRVSVNTVKTHVSNIYRKLAVARRRDAVQAARNLRLL